MVVEEEDKPKPEGEQPSARETLVVMVKEQQAKLAKHKEGLKEKKLFNENIEQLFVQMEKVLVEAEQLLQSEKDWEEVQPEFEEKVERFNHLQAELGKELQQQQRARDEEMAKLRKKLKERREELKGIDELLAEIEVEGAKVERLYELEKDWDEVKEEITERVSHLNQLQLEFAKKPKKAGDFRKWARAREMAKMTSLVIEDRNVKEFKEVLENTTKGLNDIESFKKYAKDRGLSMGEYLQLRTLGRLEEISFQSYNSEARDTTRFAMDNIPAVHFQAETTETMLKVREEQTKTAKILDGILEEQKQMREQTFSKKHLWTTAGAAALLTISGTILVTLVIDNWEEIVAFFKG